MKPDSKPRPVNNITVKEQPIFAWGRLWRQSAEWEPVCSEGVSQIGHHGHSMLVVLFKPALDPGRIHWSGLT